MIKRHPKLPSAIRAPEFSGISRWYNTQPLSIAGLRGKAVLVDFWTYSCVNCLRTLPHLRRWHREYSPKGLVIVGVHTPEFEFEKLPENLEASIRRLRIEYPVAMDNEYITWNLYANRYWPAHYLIDQEGRIVHQHFGEGAYEETEALIRKLLGLPLAEETDLKFEPSHFGRVGTPEIYFGLNRLTWLGNKEEPGLTPRRYEMPHYLPPNFFGIQGLWRFAPEYLELESESGTIKLNFYAAKVYMVAQSATFRPVAVKISVDGKAGEKILVDESRLYPLFDGDVYGPHLLELECEKGLSAYTFTFG